MGKRISRFGRRSIVGVIVGLAFAAAAGVGLAQITSEPSTNISAVTTTTQSTGTQASSKHSRTTTGTTSTAAQQTAATTTGPGQEKVDVCHVTGNGSSHTINVAKPAVAAHLAHGDTEGACATTTTTTKKTKKPKHVHSSVHVSSTAHGNSSHATTHVSHASHTSHGNSGHSSHGNSGASHGNGHNK